MLRQLLDQVRSPTERVKLVHRGFLAARHAGWMTRSLYGQASPSAQELKERLSTVDGAIETARQLIAQRSKLADDMRDLRRKGRMAIELARADADVREALEVFALHEHRTTVYRAQAVLLMKFLEHQALRALAMLPEGRVEQLRDIALQIRHHGLSGGEHTRGDAQCGQCVRQLAPDLRGGDCCSGMVFLGWDELDATFRVLLGERAPILREFEGDWTRCGFLARTGCVLTPGSRPLVCASYYCQGYQEDLRRDGRWQALAEHLAQLNAGRRAMGFRVNLNRRFIQHDSKAASHTHPLDFVWDRLRDRGAERTARGADGPNRLNVVSS